MYNTEAMLHELVYYPSDILRTPAKLVTEFTGELDVLAKHMREIMKTNNGMGLAAPQVGEAIQLIIVEYLPGRDSGEKTIPFTVLVNPKITKTSKHTDVMNEGCLSIPYVEVAVTRPTEVTVEAQDTKGNPITMHAKGLFARILQHELDHLAGKLILDYEPVDQKREKPRTIVWGSTEFTTTVMNSLRSTCDITHIVTEAPKPTGRKQELTPTIARKYADTLGIPALEPSDLHDPKLYNYLLSCKPDLMIVAAYGRLIPQNLYEIARFGTLNVHPSMLPKYRGATPIQAAILNGDKETGVTIMKLAPQFDTGEIVAQAPFKLDGTETYGDLEYILAELGGEMLKEILPMYLRGELETIPQNDAIASKTQKITAATRWLNMNDAAEVNERKVRAYSPDPGAFVLIDGQTMKVHAAHIENGTLIFDLVQPAGKKPMAWDDFLRGYRKDIVFSPFPESHL